MNDKAKRQSPLAMSGEEFRQHGHELVDRIAELIDSFSTRAVTPGESPLDVRAALKQERQLPVAGEPAEQILKRARTLLFNHSLFNSHARFWGYITAPSAPIGILGDLLASAVNPNCGGWKLAPMATEIELQTVRWLAELIGYPTACSGALVSGGNMANFVGFLAARTAMLGQPVREHGLAGESNTRFRIYTSAETHTWIHKAADLFGFGTDCVRWIPTDTHLRMDTEALRKQIDADRVSGDRPLMVVGTAGSVSTGAVDPLPVIAEICRKEKLWFHVDGAYGGFAACSDEAPDDIRGLALADSVAVDPHKWLYAPLEAGCALVRNPQHLRDAFAYHPVYYHFSVEAVNLVDHGLQNSRGFRALKVWLALQQAGREGYEQMIGDDIRFAHLFHEMLDTYEEIERVSVELSISTFRFVPKELKDRTADSAVAEYLNELNRELLVDIENCGELFVSTATVDGRFLLRLCIVNFRTTLADLEAVPEVILRLGHEVDTRLRPESLKA